MVFSHVFLVCGFVVETEEAMRIAQILDPDFDPDVDDALYHNGIKGKVQIYPYRCCSKLAEKMWVVGILMSKWWRKDVQCEDCTYFEIGGKMRCLTNCDNCLGQTVNRRYDIDAIFNTVVTVDPSRVCSFCKTDFDAPFSSPEQSLEVSSAALMTPTVSLGKCPKCNHKHNDRNWNSIGISVSSSDFRKAVIGSHSLQYILMIDDCTSCS